MTQTESATQQQGTQSIAQPIHFQDFLISIEVVPPSGADSVTIADRARTDAVFAGRRLQCCHQSRCKTPNVRNVPVRIDSAKNRETGYSSSDHKGS